ncbi:hypothetical protein J2853_002739 [Streptosporangium lutulentum]|uniref:Uncharacterized protein n=1 Tax=Streptosporangium lutulentum TaxID=1461250 RepID=A0ABT9QB58_9ACTN|nr:hypothetical protein [Streptosporangium lutulentum]MDP9843528.1 hypothetical protein [Streptosporangium lutulentum]
MPYRPSVIVAAGSARSAAPAVHQAVRERLDTTGLTALFTIHPTLAEATRSLQRPTST